jgi:hypothetical protein
MLYRSNDSLLGIVNRDAKCTSSLQTIFSPAWRHEFRMQT